MVENRIQKRVSAIARHTGDGGLGVEFLDLSPDNVERLAAFVDENW